MATATAQVDLEGGNVASTGTAILPKLLEEKSSRRWRSVVDEAKKLSSKRSRKASLLTDAARQFNELERPSQTDISLFKELFYQLVEGCEPSHRRQLSALLARNDYLPRQIAVFLAIDDYDIAAPVLLFSPVLNEADLVLLAQRLPEKHRAVVCRRETLTPAAVRALVKHGGKPCSLQLEKNPKVQSNPDLFQALSGKGPVSMNETVSKAFAKERKTREVVEIAGSSVDIPPQPTKETADSIRSELVSLAGAGGRLGSKSNPSRSTGSENHTPRAVPLHRRLLGPARKRNPAAIAAVIAGQCGLPTATVKGLLEHGGTDNVIVLFKGLGIDIQNAMQLMLLMDGDNLSNSAAYDRVRSAYRNVDAGECRSFLRSLGATLEADTPAPKLEESPRPSLALIAARRRQSLSSLSRPTEQTGPDPDAYIPLGQTA